MNFILRIFLATLIQLGFFVYGVWVAHSRYVTLLGMLLAILFHTIVCLYDLHKIRKTYHT